VDESGGGSRSLKVLIQIGYQKAHRYRKEGQRLQVWINEEECSWIDKCGKYITSRMDASKGVLWYLWKGEVSPGDTIRMKVSTSIVGVGPDERRTFERIYYVAEDARVSDITVQGVGSRGYPLIKGRILEMASVSAADEREAEIEEFVEDEY